MFARVSSSLLLCRIVFSTPLAVLTYFLIWYVPPFEDGKVIWYLFFYCGFQTLQTVSAESATRRNTARLLLLSTPLIPSPESCSQASAGARCSNKGLG